jgi:hypothetical protein
VNTKPFSLSPTPVNHSLQPSNSSFLSTALQIHSISGTQATRVLSEAVSGSSHSGADKSFKYGGM